MVIREISSSEKEKFNAVVDHPCQSWEWGEFRQKMGLTVIRLGVFKKAELVSAYQFTLHRLPFLPYTIGYLPRGPKPDQAMIEALKKIGQEKKTIFFRIEPNLLANAAKTLPELQPAKRPFFYQDTFLIDLTKKEAALLAAMKSKTRYNLRLAQRHGVQVSEDNSDQAFAEYIKLLQETTQRQGFFAHGKKYHQQMWQALQPTGIARLLKAKYKGQVLAIWILFKWHDVLYYPYGASSSWYRHLMASNLMMWETIRLGKKLNCKTLDLWGCLGEKPDSKHPWYGFHHFKAGYGGDLVRFVGSFDLVLQPQFYQLYNVVDATRWGALNLKSRFQR